MMKILLLYYVNPSWIRFAEENGLIENFLTMFPLGTLLEKMFTKSPMKDFYINSFKTVLATGKVWRNEYECSSVDEYRYFHQIVYPLKKSQGLIIVNSLVIALPMDEVVNRKIHDANKELYIKDTVFITQCSNCRRVQRNDESEIWDWVPTWVAKMPIETSHSYCPTCFDHHWKFFSANTIAQ